MANPDFGYDVNCTVGAAALTQFQLVKTPTAIVQSAASTDDCYGVVQNGASANDTECSVRIFGVTYVIAGAAIAQGAALMPAAAGKVVTHDGTSTNPFVGIALEAAAADTNEILAFIGTPSMLAGPAA